MINVDEAEKTRKQVELLKKALVYYFDLAGWTSDEGEILQELISNTIEADERIAEVIRAVNAGIPVIDTPIANLLDNGS